jgi:hypothetical protein
LSKRFAEGPNYSIDLEGVVATCRVWARPDLDSASGARCATEKASLFQTLAKGDTAGMLFDLTHAPAVTGPKTQEALGQMMKSWQDAGKPIAIVTGSNPMRKLQLRRLISTFAPVHAAVFDTMNEASAWLGSKLTAP